MKANHLLIAVTAMTFGPAALVAQAGGIPVANPIEAGQLQLTIENGLQQIEQLKQQINAVTGAYARGAQGLSDAIRAASVVPGSWQDVVAQQAGGAYGSAQQAVEKVIQTTSPTSFTDAGAGANYKLSTDAARAGLAGAQSLYNEAGAHLANFVQLAQLVDTTVNVKDAADLQNRMSAELGMAQAAQTKLQALAANLTATQVNETNQATAARMKFFGQTQ